MRPKTASALPLLFLLLCLPVSASGQEGADRFVSAVREYQAGQFDAAARHFEAIAEGGVHNGRLFYNIGNAWLKAERLGRAVLWYERAMLLIPNDPDLRFNLKYARSLTRDASPEAAETLWNVLFFWKEMFHPGTFQWIALITNTLICVVLVRGRIRRRRSLRLTAAGLGVLAVVMTGTVLYNHYHLHLSSRAVVLPGEISVRAGLTPESTELFQLHAGALVLVEKVQGAHCRIRYGKEKIGWVERSVVAPIALTG